MKPIIVDMKDMSDTTEVYESRPTPLLIYFIYLLMVILGAALLWMYFSDIDIVVKSNGIFKSGGEVYDVSCNLSLLFVLKTAVLPVLHIFLLLPLILHGYRIL